MAANVTSQDHSSVLSLRFSEFSFSFQSSITGSTLTQLGTTAGRAILELGTQTLSMMEWIRLRGRIAILKANLPLHDFAMSSDTEKLFDDLLELTRPGLYGTRIRSTALLLVLAQSFSGHMNHLVQSILKWPPVEILVFSSSVMAVLLYCHSRVEEPEDSMSRLIAVLLDLLCNLADEHETLFEAVVDSGFPDIVIWLYRDSAHRQDSVRDSLRDMYSNGFLRLSSSSKCVENVWNNHLRQLSSTSTDLNHSLADLLDLIDRDTGASQLWLKMELRFNNLVDPHTGRYIERKINTTGSFWETILNRSPFDANSKARSQEEKSRSDAIDKQLYEDRQRFKRECKILLLGSDESGKSRIMNQMKIIQQGGYTPEELASFRLVIYRNVLESAQALVKAMRKLDLHPIHFWNRVLAERIRVYQLESSNFVLSQEIAEAIHMFYQDPVVPKIMDEHSSSFYLTDSAQYFLAEVIRIGSPGYMPNVTDVLHAELPTTAITETRFLMGQLSIHIFDVSGQHSEFRKWIHCFENVTSIIFCTALSEYDQEEKNQNRLAASLALFESIVNSRWLLRTTIILFLTKIDEFKNKLPRVPLERYFPEYIGGNDVIKATKYILWKFMQANRAQLAVYPHLTRANDTSSIKLVFSAVNETILQNSFNGF